MAVLGGLFTLRTRWPLFSLLLPFCLCYNENATWVLGFGVTALPYDQQTNPVLAGSAWRAIQEVLAEYQARG